MEMANSTILSTQRVFTAVKYVIMVFIYHYEKKIQTLIVNYFFYTNKTNNHLSPQTIEH